MSDILWNHEEPIADLGAIKIPAWIEPDISPSTVAAILQGGRASGVYMPAVTYYEARRTMDAYGDEVLDYLYQTHGEIPSPERDPSWSGLACFYLSRAVETWAAGIAPELEEALTP